MFTTGRNTMDDQSRHHSLGPGFETVDLKQNKRIPLPIFLFLLVSLLLAGISMGMFPETFSDYKIFREAEERTRTGETSAALQDLYEVLQEHPDSLPVTLKLIEISMDTGCYDLAAHVFNEYLIGKSLSDGQYARMMRYSRRLESYYRTCNAVEELAAELEAEADESEEKKLGRLRGELEKLHEDEKQDQALLYYYEGITASDPEEYYGCLQKAYAKDPELFNVRVLLGNEERNRGNLTKARELLEAALAKEGRDEEALEGLAALEALEEGTQ